MLSATARSGFLSTLVSVTKVLKTTKNWLGFAKTRMAPAMRAINRGICALSMLSCSAGHLEFHTRGIKLSNLGEGKLVCM